MKTVNSGRDPHCAIEPVDAVWLAAFLLFDRLQLLVRGKLISRVSHRSYACVRGCITFGSEVAA